MKIDESDEAMSEAMISPDASGTLASAAVAPNLVQLVGREAAF